MEKTEFQKTEGRFNRARVNLLFAAVVTTVNFFLVYYDTGYYFLFSAIMPIVYFYWGPIEAVLAIAMLAAYFLCCLLSAWKRVFMLVATILFVIDCIFLAYIIYYLGIGDFWLEIAFHAWIMFYLVTGVIAWIRIRSGKADGSGGSGKTADFGRDGFGASTKDDMAKQAYPEKFNVRLMLFIPIICFAYIGLGVFTSFESWIVKLIQGYHLSDLNSNDTFGMMLGAIFTLSGVFLAYIFMRWRMVVTEGVIHFTPCLGKTRAIPLESVKRIRIEQTPGYAAYNKENKRLFSVNIYHRGYTMLAKAISPHINNPTSIPFPPYHFESKKPNSEDGGEYLRGTRADDINWYITEYSDNEIDKTALITCKHCRLDNFSAALDAVQGAVEVECTYCKEKRLLLDSEEFWEDSEPEPLKCPDCGSAEFNIGVGFVHRQSGDVKWVYIGARCSGCGLLGCPADWKIDYSPTDELEQNV